MDEEIGIRELVVTSLVNSHRKAKMMKKSLFGKSRIINLQSYH